WENPLVGLSGLFLSPAKSIFLYSPTYALALVGLVGLLRRAPGTAWPIIRALGIHLAIVSNLSFWAGEWAWGPRYPVATRSLVSVGLPFAIAHGRRRALKVGVVAAGVAVQLLAISVDHQRYYFERGYAPFFWTDQSVMYKGSPLLMRPGELG